MNVLDHLVFAAPDLDAGIEYVHELTGLRAEYGGIHPGFGTHNALLSLGARSYLEIIAPDPGQDSAIWLGIGDLESPRIVTWAACCNDLPRYAGLEFPDGQRPGAVMSMSRETRDNEVLSWSLTDPRTVIGDGLVPFLIDWGESPHPAASAPGGATLRSLVAEHPDPERIGAILRMLDVELPVTQATSPAIVAIIETPAGRVEIR